MKYTIAAILFSILFSCHLQNGYAQSAGKADTNVQNHIIKNSAPFMFIKGQSLVGNLGYEFDNIQERSHTSYVVEYNGVGFEIGGGYRIRNLGIYTTLGINLLNYWSGHLIETRNNKDSTKTYTEGVITEHGYPNNQFIGSVGLEYSFRLSPYIQFVPFVVGKTWKYKENRFIPKTKYDDHYYQLEDNYSFGGGVTLKGRLPNRSAIAIGVCFLQSHFNPDGYFQSLNAANLETYNNIIEFSLSYEFNFSGYQVDFLHHRFSFY